MGATISTPPDAAAETSTRPPRRRRVVLWVGVLILLVGLGLLGYVGWQLFGTNVVSHQRAEKIETQTRQAWQQGKAGPAQAILEVPRFGRDFSVPIIRGFGDEELAKGVARYPDGAAPGQVGNLVLAGHRVTHGQPFHEFPSLRRGDRVVVETRDATYTYSLRESGTSVTVPFTTSWPLWPVPAPDAQGQPATKSVVTLVTCSELFHTDNRSVVVGDLVRTQARSAQAR